MAPNKHWMSLASSGRLSPEYNQGVKEFLSYAFTRLGQESIVIKCPCVKCCNSREHTRDVVKAHLIAYGILQGYTFWYHHGEMANEPESDVGSDDEMEQNLHRNEESEGDSQDGDGGDDDDETDQMTRDLFPIYHGLNEQGVDFGPSGMGDSVKEPDAHAMKFFRLFDNLQESAYPSSKCSKLSAMMKLLHIKSLGRWSNKSFTMLLEFLNNELLPSGSTLAESYYQALLKFLWLPDWERLVLWMLKTKSVYDEIVENSTQDPSLSALELVEMSYGPLVKGRVPCFGYGVTPRTLRGPTPSKAELTAQIKEKDKMIRELTSRVGNLEQIEADNQRVNADNQRVMAGQQMDIAKLYDLLQKLSEVVQPQEPNVPSPSSPAL